MGGGHQAHPWKEWERSEDRPLRVTGQVGVAGLRKLRKGIPGRMNEQHVQRPKGKSAW